MAKIQFKDYYVEKLEYNENENYNENLSNTFEVETSPHVDIIFKENFILIVFEDNIGTIENENCPFTVNIKLNAFFEYSVEQNENDKKILNNLVSQNALAIIYPYIRSLVADITQRSNRFPSFILPTINIAKLIEDNDAINFHYLNSDK
ncbi:protein-export chaperone SecB [Enterococcus faecalis]|uniref:protein-export chaperone SecB n=1 Tax=Enterococcus TaxID=1350 RepID=UPI00053BD92E|nr:protein-export chaperone SecB [Enterococcus faecalis]EHQ8839927.1 protein-export chaperone SecB [Enterococcus faecalis]KII54385.1 hypothetical protein QR19_03855 [Enterococcus faecalis]MDN3112422.1 protein-export chaperone SecB [Enterococcus faecalis]HBI2038616.1 protein-export chaperone SecB [Enterococcus faecalis]HBI2080489.1 protein-export chaperone SecB [Enterococcus faecalis]